MTRLAITVAVMGVIASIGSCTYASEIAANDTEVRALREEFRDRVHDIDSARMDDCRATEYQECADLQDPNAFFGGALDEVIERRDAALERKGITLLGTWSAKVEMGHYEPDTSGIYLPWRPCRLDSLPATLRGWLC